uniref:CASP-like protein n=1 Tax=Ascaris lumbricoides TaxID=6252 RepID=A0A0M3IC84_ASCLU
MTCYSMTDNRLKRIEKSGAFVCTPQKNDIESVFVLFVLREFYKKETFEHLITSHEHQAIEHTTTDDMSFCLEKGSFAGASAALISAYIVAVCFASGIGFTLYRSNHQKY